MSTVQRISAGEHRLGPFLRSYLVGNAVSQLGPEVPPPRLRCSTRCSLTVRGPAGPRCVRHDRRLADRIRHAAAPERSGLTAGAVGRGRARRARLLAAACGCGPAARHRGDRRARAQGRSFPGRGRRSGTVDLQQAEAALRAGAGSSRAVACAARRCRRSRWRQLAAGPAFGQPANGCSTTSRSSSRSPAVSAHPEPPWCSSPTRRRRFSGRSRSRRRARRGRGGLTGALALVGVSGGMAVLATLAYRLFNYWLYLPRWALVGLSAAQTCRPLTAGRPERVIRPPLP